MPKSFCVDLAERVDVLSYELDVVVGLGASMSIWRFILNREDLPIRNALERAYSDDDGRGLSSILNRLASSPTREPGAAVPL